MARIVVTTFGSAGDLHPFIALALALRARGHEVHFAVEANFQPQLAALGFPVHLLSGDQEIALAPYRQQIFSNNQPLRSLSLLIDHYIVPTLSAHVRELQAICQQADLLIAVASQFAAAIVAELLSIRWLSVVLTPSTLPSAEIAAQPLPFALPPTLQRLSNRLSWYLGKLALQRIVDRPINAVRRSWGLPPRSDLLWTGALSPRSTILAVSPAFLPRPADWPHFIQMSGFWFWDAAESWKCPAALRVFLEGKRPVVAVTGGSFAPAQHALFEFYYRTSVTAIRACGARALVIGAPTLGDIPQGDGSAPAEADVFALAYAPFSAIFPNCAAVIHHGGIGTIAQCLRAGVPSLVVPGGMDQPFNAAQVVQRKAGLWVPRPRYTHAHAERAVSRLLGQPFYRANARAMQAQISQEDGVATACQMIEQVLNTPLAAFPLGRR